MSEQTAVGVHIDENFKLGLRPTDPDMRFLQLGDFLTGVTPQHPTSVDYLSNITFGMYANDKFGVCGPVSVANSRREITARLSGAMAPPSQNDVYDLYRRSGNPRFDPATGADDNGVNMQVMLGALNAGGIGGVNSLGFAKVNGANLEEVKAAIAIFGFLLFGVNLQNSQQKQTDAGVWDYNKSSEWGGHAILGGAYKDDVDVITWAKRVRMTKSFMSHQLSEAWVVIWPEHLADAGFLEGVDIYEFAEAYQTITGKKFPATLPPKPIPGPTPIPVPTPTPAAPGILTIDPAAKRIVYPVGWTATQAHSNEPEPGHLI